MPSAAEEYDRLRERVEEMKEEKSRARGALDELLKRMKEELGFKTVEDMRKWQRKAPAELSALEEKLRSEIAAVEEEMGDD